MQPLQAPHDGQQPGQQCQKDLQYQACTSTSNMQLLTLHYWLHLISMDLGEIIPGLPSKLADAATRNVVLG